MAFLLEADPFFFMDADATPPMGFLGDPFFPAVDPLFSVAAGAPLVFFFPTADPLFSAVDDAPSVIFFPAADLVF